MSEKRLESKNNESKKFGVKRFVESRKTLLAQKKFRKMK